MQSESSLDIRLEHSAYPHNAHLINYELEFMIRVGVVYMISAIITKIHSQQQQETQLSLTNRAMRLEVSQGHQTWYHSIC